MKGGLEQRSVVDIAANFCVGRGNGWSLGHQLGTGGTAPVFEVISPEGPRALKIYDPEFSVGPKGEIEKKRIEQQIEMKGHTCPSLVQVYDGGVFEGRLFLLMSRAPGRELEKQLAVVPRDKIRRIVHEVAEAAIFLHANNDLCHRDIKSANVFVADDYSRTTLLDISVIRNVHDPIGVGTDHDGLLPMIATARYSPPEYLFRLLEPGPDLWHALTVYQLGGLLHDLIMRKPLFQAEYEKSASNRYRFAWIVATAVPSIDADDVDRDLILLAKMALDKRWDRRLTITLEDFLLDAPEARKKHALKSLGVQPILRAADETPAVKRERVLQAASVLEQTVLQYLNGLGLRATHRTDLVTGCDLARCIRFAWDAGVAAGQDGQNKFEIRVELVRGLTGAPEFTRTCALSCSIDGARYQRELALPDIPDAPGVEATFTQDVQDAFERLAQEVLHPDARVAEA